MLSASLSTGTMIENAQAGGASLMSAIGSPVCRLEGHYEDVGRKRAGLGLFIPSKIGGIDLSCTGDRLSVRNLHRADS